MRLPTPVYESLPYLYFAICSLLAIGYHQSPAMLIAALLLYLCGSVIWVMRSNYRRRDRREHRLLLSQISRGNVEGYAPEWLYESLPFAYLAGGVTCYTLVENPLGFVSGTLLVLAGLIVLRIRIHCRHELNSSVSRI
ncbi:MULTISPECIES: hypothetical protein [Amphritea]|uniref:Uncharacterized protein n=1 Tax=Amphritea atlantica TaxID=355243 RepID=A0A1H9HWN7_9GAMM|nr:MULTISPECIES: hypothetical protein [Amphritea]MBN1007245.1 hypothetical protein [Amphritea pacifica]SEQ66672.1 hypothetical protein SAMN03080615_02267 [Amphritea atlantica]